LIIIYQDPTSNLSLPASLSYKEREEPCKNRIFKPRKLIISFPGSTWKCGGGGSAAVKGGRAFH